MKYAVRKFTSIVLVFMLVIMLIPVSAQAASKPKLNKTKATVYVGSSVTLKVSGASRKAEWSIKNKKIAVIRRSGSKSCKVVGIKAGKTTITAKIGKKSVKCTINVKNPKLNVKSKTLNINRTFQLRLTGAKIKSCTSSNPSVATVNKAGKVTTKKAGKAVVTVRASNGKYYRCAITVKDGNSSGKKPPANDNQPDENSPEDKNPPDENPPIDDPSADEAPLNLYESGFRVELSENSYVYTGEPIEPGIKVYNHTVTLEEDIDYTVTYNNNVNAGDAMVVIDGIGKYTGRMWGFFQIDQAAQNVTAELEGNSIYVGETKKLNILGTYGYIKFYTYGTGEVEISSDGTITGVGLGRKRIYMDVLGDENHSAVYNYYVGEISVTNEEASAWGFDMVSYSSYDTYKMQNINSRNSDGSNTYSALFLCDSDVRWLDKNVSFEVEDVTPAAYAKMFEDMGIAYDAPDISAESGGRYSISITEPFTQNGPGDLDERKTASSGKWIVIQAGAGVRVVKVTAKAKDGTVLDYIYLGTNGCEVGNQKVRSAYDLALYKQVRERIEAQIWTDDMSNLEKLEVLAKYIRETTHYPWTAATSKEYNPTFWANWSVDDRELYYHMFDDAVLNRIMDLQGGIVTCVAAELLQKAAQEDLGLPYLYDGNEVADGEGVWLATGSASSNPMVSGHESLAYQSAEGQIYLLDAQGMIYYDGSDEAACEQHGCRDKIISLKQ